MRRRWHFSLAVTSAFVRLPAKTMPAWALLTCTLMIVLVMSNPAGAQDWPQRPLHLIVAFGAGGTTDVVARIVGQGMQDKLGQPVVIENRPGAAGTLGNELVARADKDGYTLGIMTAGQIIAAVMNKSLRYDTLTAFDPVSLVADSSLIVAARPEFPANDVRELIDLAKANPGKVSFGNSGFGATPHLAAELFRQICGIDVLHVPFRSATESIAAVLGGQIDVIFETISPVLGQIRSGTLRALAVTGKNRFPTVPDVPAAIESGLLPGYDVTSWYGLFVPHGTPETVIVRLNSVINKVIAEEAVKEQLTKAGVVVRGSTPEGFGEHMKAEFVRWNKVREVAGIPLQ
jgi:tripartite-type tricarboxylate transporter receptor subunit TctC